MKKYTTFLLILFCIFGNVLLAQNKISGYKFWFDNDEGSSVTTTITPAEHVELNTSVSATLLNTGLHVLNVQFWDDNSDYSSVISQFFYKVPEQTVLVKELISYEYWIDDDYTSAVSQNISNVQQFNMDENINVSSLSTGLHVISLRYKDNTNLWSSTVSQFFYKIPEQTVPAKELISYEYWLDDDYENVVTLAVSPGQQFILTENFDLNELNTGLHVINVRFKDNTQVWSNTLSHFFFKIPEQTVSLKEMIAYEYWLDGDYSTAVSETISPAQQLNLTDNIDVNSLNTGLHIINFRFRDNTNSWSSPVSQFFFKKVNTFNEVREVTQFRYWFDNAFDDVSEGQFDPSATFVNLTDQIDMTQLWKGSHILHFQFKDSFGQWSVVASDSVVKQSLPVASFDFNEQVSCDSTVIETVNTSIDADIYSWDFGDGTTSTDVEPVHTYIDPGDYFISLTVTDTLIGSDSTIVKPVSVLPTTTYSSVAPVACDNYISPSGNFNWTTSGMYSDTILNAIGCDSIITVNLTILNSTFAEIEVTACDSYTSPSGNFIWTVSGIYLDTIPNSLGCDSIITINLTIDAVDVTVTNDDPVLTANAVGAAYQWIDCSTMLPIPGEINQSFTAVINGSYAVEVTQNGCSDTSVCYPVISVGMQNDKTTPAIVCYPNPTDGMVTIDLGKEYGNVIIKVSDDKGVRQSSIQYKNAAKVIVELKGPAGLYLIGILTDDGLIKSIKVLKE